MDQYFTITSIFGEIFENVPKNMLVCVRSPVVTHLHENMQRTCSIHQRGACVYVCCCRLPVKRRARSAAGF